MNRDSVIVSCKKCGAKNRVPQTRIEESPVCGKCRTKLDFTSGVAKPVPVTDQTFREEVLHAKGLVVVDCWAAWCGPCRLIAPMMDQLAAEYSGSAKVAKLNVDENPSTASQFAIQSIPTLLFFRDGKLVKTLVGALPKGQIEAQLKALL